MDSTINEQSQSAFFRLPIEIRYIIYWLYHDNAESTPPENPALADQVPRYEQKFQQSHYPQVRYPLCYQSPLNSILATCRKLNLEFRGFQSVSQNRTAKTPVCKLDLIVTDRHVVPSWIVTPTNPVAGGHDPEYDLEVSLRLFDITCVSPLFTGGGWFPPLSWPLMAILNKLLHYGPAFRPLSSSLSSSSSQEASATSRPLPKRTCSRTFQFNAITVNISCPSSQGEGPSEIYYGEPTEREVRVPGYALRVVEDFMMLLANNGLLWGTARELRVCSMQMGKGKSFKLTRKPTNQQKREIFAVYGYVWGPVAEG